MKRLGSALASIAAVSVIFTLPVAQLLAHSAIAADCPVIFEQKLFVDSGKNVYVRGTFSGEGFAYKYNTVSIDCDNATKKCSEVRAESFGAISGVCQIGVTSAMPFRVVHWSDDRIIASFDAPCGSAIYVVDRRAQTVQLTQRFGPEKPGCSKRAETALGRALLDGKTYHWTLDDPPFWKDWNQQGPEEAFKKLPHGEHE